MRAILSIPILVLLGCGDDEARDDFELAEDRPEAIGCEADAPAVSQADLAFDPDLMHCVKITMDPADYARMAVETRFGATSTDVDAVLGAFFSLWSQCGVPWPSRFDWYAADVEIDGLRLERVGVRKKGFIGSVFASVPSLEIKTDKYVEGQRLGDTERLTLNNNDSERSRVRSCLTYGLFADAGHPAPRCGLASVSVNGEPLGAYTRVEPVKSRFLRRAFGDDGGSLYEGTLADFDATSVARWEPKTGATDVSLAPLAAVTRALEASDADLVDALSPVLDIDRFLTFWALEVVSNHGDGYAADRNNFFVYFDPASGGRAVFVPWGVDKTFGESKGDAADLRTYLLAALPARLSRIPSVARRMEAELTRVLDEVWDEAALLARVDRLGALVRAAQRDEDHDAELASVRAWIRARPGVIEAGLAEGLPRAGPPEPSCGGSK